MLTTSYDTYRFLSRITKSYRKDRYPVILTAILECSFRAAKEAQDWEAAIRAGFELASPRAFTSTNTSPTGFEAEFPYSQNRLSPPIRDNNTCPKRSRSCRRVFTMRLRKLVDADIQWCRHILRHLSKRRSRSIPPSACLFVRLILIA